MLRTLPFRIVTPISFPKSFLKKSVKGLVPNHLRYILSISFSLNASCVKATPVHTLCFFMMENFLLEQLLCGVKGNVIKVIMLK